MTETLILVMVMLAPGLVARVLQMQADDAAYLLAPAGVGMFLGTSLVGRFGNHFHRETLINAGLVALGLCLVALALVEPISLTFQTLLPSPVPVVMVLTFLMGLGVALISVPAQTILQERSPLALRGRVFGVQFTLVNLASIPVLLFVGALADILGITRILMVVAVLVLVLGGLSTRFGHDLLGEGHHPPQPTLR